MDNEITIKYSNADITILWKPKSCIHSKRCWKELGSVFKPSERPWIQMEGTASEKITEQVNKCPSGALSLYKNDDTGDDRSEIIKENILEVSANGPLLFHGNIIVRLPDGSETNKNKTTAFCRCGKSSNKPYCDGTHTAVNFEA